VLSSASTSHTDCDRSPAWIVPRSNATSMRAPFNSISSASRLMTLV
jgi:hypothetical protein